MFTIKARERKQYRQMTVKFPAEIFSAAETEAKKLNVTTHRFVNELVRQYLESQVFTIK